MLTTQIELPLKIRLQFEYRPLSPSQARQNIRVRCAGWNTDVACDRPVTRFEPAMLQEPVHEVYDGLCPNCESWLRVKIETTFNPRRYQLDPQKWPPKTPSKLASGRSPKLRN